MFKFSEKAKIEAMNQLNQGMIGGNGFDIANEMIVQQTKMADQLFEKFGIEEEEFNRAAAKMNMLQDPEIKNIMKESMSAMPPEMMQAMMA